MGLEIKQLKELSGRKVPAGERMFLTADKNRVVSKDSPEAAFLYAGHGSELPIEDVEKFGLVKKGEAYFLPDAEQSAEDAQNGTEDPEALVPVEQFNAVSERLNDTLTQLDKAKSDYETATVDLETARFTVGQKDAEIAGLKADGEAASEDLSQRDATINDLKAENEKLKNANEDLKTKLETAKSDLAKAKDAAKAKTAPEENKAVKSAPETK